MCAGRHWLVRVDFSFQTLAQGRESSHIVPQRSIEEAVLISLNVDQDVHRSFSLI
jgi:hypothetical protein